MRAAVLLPVLALFGCASAPPNASSPSSPADSVKTAYVTPSGQSVAQVQDPNMDPKRLAEAKKLGVRIINENGQTLYCRTEMSTGSRVVRSTDTKCETPEQWEAERVANQQAMAQWRSNSAKAGN